MKKIIRILLVCVFLMLTSAGCKSAEHEADFVPGPGLGDMKNLYEMDGKILMSEDPTFVLYMDPEIRSIENREKNRNVEGMFQNENGEICHFYVSNMYSTATSVTVALIKENAVTDYMPYKPNDKVYMYCEFIHKSDREIVQVHDGSDSTQFKAKQEEIILRQLDLEPSETAEYFKKLQTLPKDQWPEVSFKTGQ